MKLIRWETSSPQGQPILIGHYSEGRDRRYRDRIQNKFEKGVEESKKAEYFEQRAAAASEFKDRTFNLGTTLRRIAKLKATVRSIELDTDRYIARWEIEQLRIKRGLQDEKYETLSRKVLEEEDSRKAKYLEQIAYWTQKVEESGSGVESK